MKTTISIFQSNQSSREGLYPGVKDHILLWVLFLSTIAVIYLLPKVWDYIFILGVFVLFAISKRDSLWLAYYIILYTAPMGFFAEGSQEAIFRLPLFKLGGGLSFSTLHLLLRIGLVKAFLKRNKVDSFFSKHFQVLLVYVFFLIAIALIVHRTSMSVLLDGMKHAFGISFIYIIYKLIDVREEKYRFIFLLLPFGFLILLDATYFMVTGGEYIYNLFNPYTPRRVIYLGIDSQNVLNIRFQFIGFYLSYLIFIFSMSFWFICRNKVYLLTSALAAFVIVIAGALRSWFVIYAGALLLFIYYNYNSGILKRSIVIAAVTLLLILPIIRTPVGSAAFSGAFQRISTVFTLGEESSLASQQIEAKIDKRLPSQLQYIKDNPLTGWAFTEKRGDPDVGNFGLLVDAGIIGFLIFAWFWISYLSVISKHIAWSYTRSARNALRMLIVLFLGILLSHFTTNMVFIYYGGIFVGTFVFISEFIISEAQIFDEQTYRSEFE